MTQRGYLTTALGVPAADYPNSRLRKESSCSQISPDTQEAFRQVMKCAQLVSPGFEMDTVSVAFAFSPGDTYIDKKRNIATNCISMAPAQGGLLGGFAACISIM